MLEKSFREPTNLQLEEERVNDLHDQWDAECKKIVKILESRKRRWTIENGVDALDAAESRRAELAREVIAGKIGLLPLLRSELEKNKGNSELEKQIKEIIKIAEIRLGNIRRQIQENQELAGVQDYWLKAGQSAPGEGRAVDMRNDSIVKLMQEEKTIIEALGYNPQTKTDEFFPKRAA